MATKKSDEQKAKKMAKLLVFATKEAMSAAEPPTETKGGNPITYRYWCVADRWWVVAVNKTDAAKRAFLAGVLDLSVVEVVKSTPAAAKAALDSLTPEQRKELLKGYKA
jgi:hypothetical protein